jgi:UDP-N-acetylmuramoylalanine--D-glutamate ligase
MKLFEDKRILVVGLARSGVGAANLLSSYGASVCVTDIKHPESLKDNIKRLLPQVEVIAGEHPEKVFINSDMIVVSPGVPLDISPLKAAQKKGIPIISEIELAYQMVQSEFRSQSPLTPKFIGITGTNGKSTTTTLIDMMLKRSGFKTVLGGNIGNALTEELYSRFISQGLRITDVDYIVSEVSSFQLEAIQDFRPFVSLILNITADHLDRYPDMQGYIDAKARIFKNQADGDYLILNADDPIVMGLYNSRFHAQDSGLNKINILFFSCKKEVEGIFSNSSYLHLNLFPTPGTAPSLFLRKGYVPPLHLIAINDIKMKGAHNLENVMASSLTALICGCSIEAIVGVLEEFPGLEHRLEFICEIDGVRFVNDSKGTNVGAVAKSLESFENILLIMGGRDKYADFTVLKDLVKRKVKTLILLGEAKKRIAQALSGMTEIIFVEGIKEAVKVSMSKASAGDVVLLSPGCASFDMFKNFEDRGERFKEAVREIQDSRVDTR